MSSSSRLGGETGGKRAPLPEVGFAGTTYGDRAAGSAGSDGLLVRRYSLKCHWQDYCGRNYPSGRAEIQVGTASRRRNGRLDVSGAFPIFPPMAWFHVTTPRHLAVPGAPPWSFMTSVGVCYCRRCPPPPTPSWKSDGEIINAFVSPCTSLTHLTPFNK